MKRILPTWCKEVKKSMIDDDINVTELAERALVHADNVLILDEATSALDNITQNEIMKNIKPLYQDKIVIIITHRLDTISDVDKIFVMSEGRICEEGQHNELMKKGEKYYALVQNL